MTFSDHCSGAGVSHQLTHARDATAERDQLRVYCEELEAALVTARALVAERDAQLTSKLAEVKVGAEAALRTAMDAATKRVEAQALEVQKQSVRAAMDAAAKAQQRAVAAAVKQVADKAAADKAAAVAAALATERGARNADRAEMEAARIAEARRAVDAEAAREADRAAAKEQRAAEMAEFQQAVRVAAAAAVREAECARSSPPAEPVASAPAPPSARATGGGSPTPMNTLSAAQQQAVERALAAARTELAAATAQGS